jgi:hypothetical protein
MADDNDDDDDDDYLEDSDDALDDDRFDGDGNDLRPGLRSTGKTRATARSS